MQIHKQTKYIDNQTTLYTDKNTDKQEKEKTTKTF